jgi:copper chaperone CopZ
VTAVDVALEAGTVRVDGSPDVAAVSAAIEDAGYDVTTPRAPSPSPSTA